MSYGKTIKHGNVMSFEALREDCKSLQIICRGCTITQTREDIWRGFCSSNSVHFPDNSYMTLEEEPENPYDPNAVMVVCRGEFFGTMGYVGREFTEKVKTVLEECASYRLDIIDENDVGRREITLLLTWS